MWRWHTLPKLKKVCIFWRKLNKPYSINFCRVSNHLNTYVHKQALFTGLLMIICCEKKTSLICCWVLAEWVSSFCFRIFCILISGRSCWTINIFTFPFKFLPSNLSSVCGNKTQNLERKKSLLNPLPPYCWCHERHSTSSLTSAIWELSRLS